MIHFTSFFVVRSLAVLTVLAALPTRGAAAQVTPPVATVIDVQGPVTLRGAREAAFHAAMAGESLFTGSIVRTGVRGHATLKWRNGGDFKLLPLGELVVPEDEGVLLNAGKVWAQFQEKLLAPFYFKSPGATAVVRGTTLGVEWKPEGETIVEVLEGRVEVTSAKGGPSRMLEPGQSLTVSPFGQFGPIQPLDPGLKLFERQTPGSGPGGRPMRPDGGPGGPGGPGMKPDGAPGGRVSAPMDWLRNNRASMRLEPMRQEERSRRVVIFDGGGRQGGRMGGAITPPQPGDPNRTQPAAVDPNRAFPAGRALRPDGSPPLNTMVDCFPNGTATPPRGPVIECPAPLPATPPPVKGTP